LFDAAPAAEVGVFKIPTMSLIECEAMVGVCTAWRDVAATERRRFAT
jgi:hypothetical protein